MNTAYRALNNATTELWMAENKLATVKGVITTLKGEIDTQEKAVAKAQDQINAIKENIANNEERQATWNAVVAALTPDYAAEVKTLATNKAVTDYIAAIEVEDAAKLAYNEIGSKITAVSGYLTGSNSGEVFDPAAEINKLELAIAGLKKNIEELKDNYSVAGNNADEYEKLIAYTEAEIKELEGEIEIQTEIVELAKKRVEAYIAAQK